MTRDEFIDGYMKRGGLSASYRTSDGFGVEDRRVHALPCACGDEICQGWAMVSEELVADHMRMYAPPAA